MGLISYALRCRIRGLTINVLSLVLADLADLEFTVGSLRGAVTSGEIVDDETQDVLARDAGCKLLLQLVDVCNGVEPEERSNVSDLSSSGGQALVAEVLDCSLDLGLVEGVGVEGVGLEDVLAATELDGRVASALVDGLGGQGSGEGGQGQD